MIVDGVPGHGCGGDSKTDIRGEVEWRTVGHLVSRDWQTLGQGTRIYPGHFPVKLSSQSREPEAELY